MLPINDNSIKLDRYKGKVRRCPHCTPERILNDPQGRACLTCLNRGFVADCLNCEATGMYKGSAAAFGGGDHLHASTCNYCGGKGVFPVNKPTDWKDDPTAAAPQLPIASVPAPV